MESPTFTDIQKKTQLQGITAKVCLAIYSFLKEEEAAEERRQWWQQLSSHMVWEYESVGKGFATQALNSPRNGFSKVFLSS